MTKKIMVFYASVPDMAWGSSVQSPPLGVISGRGCIIPAVTCPKKPNDRTSLEACFLCENFVEQQPYSIECSFEIVQDTPKQLNKKEDMIEQKQEKNTGRGIKKPSGVFTQ